MTPAEAANYRFELLFLLTLIVMWVVGGAIWLTVYRRSETFERRIVVEHRHGDEPPPRWELHPGPEPSPPPAAELPSPAPQEAITCRHRALPRAPR